MSDFDELKNLGAQWYVAHTYSGYENKVKTSLEAIIKNRNLEDQFFEIIIPVQSVIEKKIIIKDENGKKKKKVARQDFDFSSANPEEYEEIEEIVETKLFPTYVYIKMIMSDETWHAVRNITGVTGFVGPGSKPAPLEADEVAMLMSYGATEPASTETFAVGDKVEITSGTLSALTQSAPGILSEISENGIDVTVLVSSFGRSTPIKTKISDIRKVEG